MSPQFKPGEKAMVLVKRSPLENYDELGGPPTSMRKADQIGGRRERRDSSVRTSRNNDDGSPKHGKDDLRIRQNPSKDSKDRLKKAPCQKKPQIQNQDLQHLKKSAEDPRTNHLSIAPRIKSRANALKAEEKIELNEEQHQSFDSFTKSNNLSRDKSKNSHAYLEYIKQLNEYTEWKNQNPISDMSNLNNFQKFQHQDLAEQLLEHVNDP